MAEPVDAVVIGAGVIGLAVARGLARSGRDVLIVEKNKSFGEEISARNSEVIHSGIYNPAESLKSKLCIKGKQQLYQFCEDYHVPYKRTGKLIVASNSNDLGQLKDHYDLGLAKGLSDLRWLCAEQAKQLEPALSCEAAIHSPSTGIVDSHAYMLALLGDAEKHGAILALNTLVTSAKVLSDGLFIEAAGQPLKANLVVNCTGLHIDQLLNHFEGFPQQQLPRLHYCKGNYFSLSGCKAPFTHLIYPLPKKAGLGVHLSLDMAGIARFGPDIEWVDRLEYSVDANRAQSFYQAVREYWPELPENSLVPSFCGVRPKLAGADGGFNDFVIQSEREHGISGLVNLLGIESPGLTSSLAIADEVVALMA